jgi:hypothetical protein
MEKPCRLEGTYPVPIYTKQGKVIPFDSLLTSRWRAPDGRTAQVIVNYTLDPQRCRLVCPTRAGRNVTLYIDPDDTGHSVTVEADGGLALEIDALSTVLVVFK